MSYSMKVKSVEPEHYYDSPTYDYEDTVSSYVTPVPTLNGTASRKTECPPRKYITVGQYRLLLGLQLVVLIAVLVFIVLAVAILGRSSKPGEDNTQIIDRPATTATIPTVAVGFTATIDGNNANLTAGDTVIYNKVITNDGSGYDPQTGVFTCPTSGLYLFSFTVETFRTHSAYASLVANGNAIAHAIAEPFHQKQDAQGSVAAVLRLTRGDRVWIRATKNKVHIFGGNSGFNVFTGVYLNK